MDFIDVQRQLVDILLKIPAMETPPGRTSLLDGLPDAGLVRDQNIARLDLNRMIGGLEKMGRLTKEGGVRPVIVVLDNALQYVPDGSEIADELQKIRKQLEDYYGGDIQPQPKQQVTDETLKTLLREALIFGQQRDARVSYAFVDQAQRTANSIARLTVPRIFNGVPDGNVGYGTGWIVAPGMLMTNHHVIDARDLRFEQPAQPADFEAQAQSVVARFDYHVEQVGGTYLECKNAKLLAANLDLDYAIIELTERDKVAGRKPLRLVPVQPMLMRGSRINIVQHPRGGPLRFAIRNNFFVSPGDKPSFLLYQTDTEPGASGSPVCNDDWQVVALHHAAQPVAPQLVPQEVIDGELIKITHLNEAIKVHDILNSLPANVKQSIHTAQGMG